ncbi:MAG: hypothetical protein EXR09_06675 [Acetobacteraceae bacterium]|nr:hypothetical protein [Acetobacteraceae bacterium]
MTVCGWLWGRGGRNQKKSSRALTLAAIAVGAALMLWPAVVNGYPLVFSDTGAFLSQALNWIMIWDKPWIYGPVLGWMSLTQSLWLPAIAQAVLVSWLLWRVLRAMGLAQPLGHVGVCLVLALGSAAPWFVSFLMADIFAPVTVLGLFLLGFGGKGFTAWGRVWLVALTSFAIATHLAHLIVAAAVLAVMLLLRPRVVWRAALPLGVALAALVASNLVGHGRFGVSPYGSLFFLARLSGDGPARDYLQRACPQVGHSLCAWVGRLPTNSDAFLWDPKGPIWSSPGGPSALAAEAGAIIRATMLSDAMGVARALVGNTGAQLVQLHLDEMLGNNWLEETVALRLREHFPPAEYVRLRAGRQYMGQLRVIAAPMQAVQAGLLGAAALGCLVTLWRERRRDPRLAGLAALILAGVLANAFATGALSGPHDRYQARIAWLLWLPPLLYAMRLYAIRRAPSAGLGRTSAS